MNDDSELVRRLHQLGDRPVDPATARRVLARAHQAPVGRLHATKVKLAAALAAGFVAGSMGLASAGTLPAPMQEVAHDALGVVGIDVPPGHDRYNGPECGGTYANHGEYVRTHKDDPNAGQSRCGKPTKAGKADGAAQVEAEEDDTQGPPASADGNGNGQGNGNGADKPAKAKGGKGKGAADDDDGNGAAESPAPTPGPEVTTTTEVTAAPTTTTAATTTTTAATSTTTAPPVTTSTSTPELSATTTVP